MPRRCRCQNKLTRIAALASASSERPEQRQLPPPSPQLLPRHGLNNLEDFDINACRRQGIEPRPLLHGKMVTRSLHFRQLCRTPFGMPQQQIRHAACTDQLPDMNDLWYECNCHTAAHRTQAHLASLICPRQAGGTRQRGRARRCTLRSPPSHPHLQKLTGVDYSQGMAPAHDEHCKHCSSPCLSQLTPLHMVL